MGFEVKSQGMRWSLRNRSIFSNHRFWFSSDHWLGAWPSPSKKIKLT